MAVGRQGIQSIFLISFTPVDRTRLRKPPHLMHSRCAQLPNRLDYNMRFIFGLILLFTLNLSNGQDGQFGQVNEEEMKLMTKIILLQKEFYDSLFSLNKFPKNDLKGFFNDEREFDFELDRSYIVDHSSINGTGSENLMDLLGGNIFQTKNGSNYVIVLHHFNDPQRDTFDDETNFSVFLQIPLIKKGGIMDLVTEKNNAKLGVFHYGPLGQLIESTSFCGQIKITELKNKIVTGTLDISFKTTDGNDFFLRGNFQLPTVSPDSFADLKKKIEKIKNNRGQ